MTPSQTTALRSALFANQTAADFAHARDFDSLRSFLNALASPDYIVWRTSVSVDEIMRNGMDWARVDNLSVGKSRIWEWFGKLGSFDPSKTNVRAGIDATWVGTTADLAVRTQVYTHCKRKATVAEKMLATGTGSDASPALLDYEGELSDHDVVGLALKDDGTFWE